MVRKSKRKTSSKYASSRSSNDEATNENVKQAPPVEETKEETGVQAGHASGVARMPTISAGGNSIDGSTSTAVNFSEDIIYDDRYVTEDLSLDMSLTENMMDSALSGFLGDTCFLNFMHLNELLPLNGIRKYPDFKKLFVDTHNFSDLDHVYKALGPNALGYLSRGVEHLVRLGHFIATHRISDEDGSNPRPIVLYDEKTKIFNPNAFPMKAWRRDATVSSRAFGPRYRKASMATFQKFKHDLRVAPHDSYVHMTTLRNMNLSSIRHDDEGDRKPRAVDDDRKPDAVPSRSRSSSDSSGKPIKNLNLKKPPTYSVAIGNNDDEPSDSSSSSSSDSSSDESSNGSEDSADSSDDSMSENESEPDDSYSDSDDSNSTSDSSSDDSTSDGESTMPSKWGSKRYKPPRDGESFMRRIKKYEKKAKKRRNNRRRDKHGGKQSKQSKSSKKSKRKFSSKRSKYYLKKRSVLTIEPWDSTSSKSFDDVLRHIRNFVKQQTEMGYIVTGDFMQLYLSRKKTDAYKEFLYENRISRRQFKADINMLHAYLCAAFDSDSSARDILHGTRSKYKRSPDGIKAYYRLNKYHGLTGLGRDQNRSRLLAIKNQHYHAGFKGGLEAFVKRFDSTCSQLQRLREAHKGVFHLEQDHKLYTKEEEQDNCVQLLLLLATEPSIQPIYTAAYNVNQSNPGNFQLLCTHIRNMERSIRADKHVNQVKRSSQKFSSLLNRVRGVQARLGSTESVDAMAVQAMMAGNFSPKDTSVPATLWRALDDDTKQRIIEVRKLLRSNAQSNDHTIDQASAQTMKTSNTSSNVRANLATIDEDDLDDGSLTDGSTDPEDYDEDSRQALQMLAHYIADELEPTTRTANAVFTVSVGAKGNEAMHKLGTSDMTVYASLGSVKRAAHSTVDGGADTYIGGIGHKVISIKAGQLANIVGFDVKHANKRGLEIGTIDCVVTCHALHEPTKPFEVILRWNQAVINTDSPTTLVSEVQTRSNGVLVDTVPRDSKRDIEGRMGTQRMVVEVDEEMFEGIAQLEIPFVKKRGLMTYEHRLPLDDDYKELRIVEMTSDRPWDPTEHTESSPYVMDAAGIPRLVEAFNTLFLYDDPREASEIQAITGLRGGSETDDDSDQMNRKMPAVEMNDDLKLETQVNMEMDDHHGAPTASIAKDMEVDTGIRVEDTTFSKTSPNHGCGFDSGSKSKGSNPDTTQVPEMLDNDQGTYTWYFDGGFYSHEEMMQREGFGDTGGEPLRFGHGEHAVHLSMDYQAVNDDRDTHAHLRSRQVDDLLNDLTYEEMIGMQIEGGDDETSTFAYVAKTVHDFHSAEKLRPNFAYRAVEAIKKTFENTTQFAKYYTPFPMQRHWRAMYKWHNNRRLAETVSTDTVLVNVPDLGRGSTCAQVFYGNASHMINVYDMYTKKNAHKAYQDFLREEGIPLGLHRDNSGEQNDTRFMQTNRELQIRDTTTEPDHPHQNPAETRAIRFLKRTGKAVMTMSGAPVEAWAYALKYVATVNNWTSHESLGWKTPFEKRHGVQPDISPLLAYRFFEPVYYQVDDGFPNTGERLGYVLGINEHAGSFMTFDILSDDMQTVLPRSVLRKVSDPVPNRSIEASDELNPILRIQDRDEMRATGEETDDDLPALIDPQAPDENQVTEDSMEEDLTDDDSMPELVSRMNRSHLDSSDDDSSDDESMPGLIPRPRHPDDSDDDDSVPDLVDHQAYRDGQLDEEMNRVVHGFVRRERPAIRQAARRLRDLMQMPEQDRARFMNALEADLQNAEERHDIPAHDTNVNEPARYFLPRPRVLPREVVPAAQEPGNLQPARIDVADAFVHVPIDGGADTFIAPRNDAGVARMPVADDDDDDDEEDDDMGIFVNAPLPMHNRKPRTPRKPSTNDEKPVAKRKEANESTEKKHAPSNKRRMKKVKRLNPTTPTDDDVDAHQEYVIDNIVTHRTNPTTKVAEVLVSWEGYDESHDSWEPVEVIKETAERTLRDYARNKNLSTVSGWKWTASSPPRAQRPRASARPTAAPLANDTAPVEGGYKRTRSQTKAAQRRANTSRTSSINSQRSRLPTMINNLLSLFGFSANNGNCPPTLKNYRDFSDEDLKKPLPNPLVPLETMVFDDPTKNISTNLAKMLEIQQLDKLNERDDEWTIIKVLSHASRRTKRRLPSGYSVEDTVKDKHTRILALFMDGDMKWIALDAALLQDPMPVIEYVRRNKLENQNKFEAVKELMKNDEKMENIRRVYKAKVSKAPRFHFGVEVPRNPTHAKLLDKVNENSLWEEASKKELKSINDHEVFRLATKDDDMREYKRIPYQMIYDVKHDLRRKARLVAGGHMTNPPFEDVYSGVVGMDTVRLAFAVGAMQDLDVCAADISTAFLYGKTKEKLYIVAGPEFGPDLEGKKLIVQGNWYGLRSAAATYHQVASAVLRKLGFRPTKVDNDLWMRKKDDHYEYLAIYVDDLLAWGKRPLDIINEVKASFKLQGIGYPEYYLGADVNPITEKHLQEEGSILGLSAKTYIKNAQFKLQKLFGGGQFHKARTPMSEHYHPEQDDSKLLGPEDTTKYRALLGSANWIVTLGRFDIAYATSTLARYSMAPREGHLAAMKRIFGYLRVFPKGELLVNPKPFKHEACKLDTEVWKEYYPDAEEELPPDQPTPLAKKAQITIYVDADHAHDTVTRRSVTGIMIFVNQTLVKYISKRQKTVETSSYGSELVAARIATEFALEYRYCLRMLGVEIDGPVRMFGDNNSVILNTTLPSSMLKKKHLGIAYHAIRNAQACGVLSFQHVRSEDNWADVLTKPLSPAKFHALVRPLLFRRSGSGDEQADTKD